MVATFLLSLDCEGKWGVADRLGPAVDEALCENRLRAAYFAILSRLKNAAMPATFAFVGGFAVDRDTLKRWPRREIAARLPFAAAAMDRVGRGELDGLVGDWARAAVAESTVGHEIGLHGGVHAPWTGIDAAAAAFDLGLAALARPDGTEGSTFIYPRNRVAHLDVLAGAGVAGFRRAPPDRSRIASLLSEFDVGSPPDDHAEPADLIALPPGRFVNWRHGARRLVPDRIVRARVRAGLEAAFARSAVIHYWTHPENMAQAPGTLGVFDVIVEAAAEARARGRCEILTLKAYCDATRRRGASMTEARGGSRISL